MLTKERLESALLQFKEVENVRVEGQPRFVATVVSGSFEHQDEADRQAAIWAHLRRQLSESELPQIEFIFTDTPSERAAS
jgi:acid stress-induced BolA-like protein IbaG/YrbA